MKLRRTNFNGNFWLAILINMLLNLEGTIPALFFLVMHFVLDWSIWFFWGALALWMLGIILWMWFIGWASSCSVPDPPKENKNPYSAKNNNQE